MSTLEVENSLVTTVCHPGVYLYVIIFVGFRTIDETLLQSSGFQSPWYITHLIMLFVYKYSLSLK